MRPFERPAGSTSNILRLRAYIASTGMPKTGLVYNTATIVAYYTRDQAAAVGITLITQTVTGAWSSGGFVEISAANAPGEYRLDVPDAVFATGVKGASIILAGIADVVFEPIEIDLETVAPLPLVPYLFQRNATSKTIYLMAYDGTTGQPKTGLVYNSAGLTAAFYQTRTAAGVAITLATLAAPDSAWATGGFKEVDATKHPGRYRMDLPNAVHAWSSGIEEVFVRLLQVGTVFEHAQITLIPDDPFGSSLTAVDVRDAILSDATPFPGASLTEVRQARLDAAISTRATPADIPTQGEIQSSATDAIAASPEIINLLNHVTTVPVVPAVIRRPAARRNLLLYSESLGTSPWGGNAAVTPRSTLAPDGTMSADTLSRVSIDDEFRYQPSGLFIGDGTKSFSAEIKEGTVPTVQFALYDVTAVAYIRKVNAAWTAGVPVLSSTLGTGTLFPVEELPGGWFRVSFAIGSVVAANSHEAYIRLEGTTANGQTAFVRAVQPMDSPLPQRYQKTEGVLEGTKVYKIRLYLTDEVGNMEAPDAAPTLALTNEWGTSLNARLGSVTGTLDGTGQYSWLYTADAAHALEQLLWEFSITENAILRVTGRTSLLVDTEELLSLMDANVRLFGNQVVQGDGTTTPFFI